MRSFSIGWLALVATPALAQGDGRGVALPATTAPPLRDLCTERPGLTTAACTVDPGHVQIEVSLRDWTLDRQGDAREDQIGAGSIVLRYGIGASTEVRLGWGAYGHVRTADRAAGLVERVDGTGDLTFSLKQNLRNPAEDERGLAVALLPSVTIPVNDSRISQGDWSAGLIVPLTYTLDESISFALSPEIDAEADEDRAGRHLAYGAAMGMSFQMGDVLNWTPEVQVFRDCDPDEPATEVSASLSLAILVEELTQFDIQAVAGLNQDTPDMMIAFGVAHKF